MDYEGSKEKEGKGETAENLENGKDGVKGRRKNLAIIIQK